MAFQLLAGGCSGGNCPKFERDDVTGDVKVTGYHPDHLGDPAHERPVVFPAETWNFLVSQLPR
jgi:hypothetical protein